MDIFLSPIVLKILGYIIGLIALLVVISLVIYSIKTPSNNKKWALGNNKTASIHIDGDLINITNYRDVDWQNLDLSTLKNDDGLFIEKK